MEPEARYTLVGATLLALALAVMIAVVWLVRSGSRDDFRYYTIYFERQSLEGLQVGGDVTMRGVKVGRVESYAIDEENINRVEVDVRVDRKTPVSQNTYAVVSRNLVTGLARISLVTPGKPGPPLTLLKPGEDYPVIAEGTSNFDVLADAANRLAGSGATALDNINQLLSPDNRAAFGATLANLRDLSGALASRTGKLDEVATSLERAANELGRSSREIAQSIARLQVSVSAPAAQAEATLRDVSRAIAQLERETAAIASRIEAATDTGALEVRATAQELRESAEILARTVDRLRDPRSALLGPRPGQLGPGERLR